MAKRKLEIEEMEDDDLIEEKEEIIGRLTAGRGMTIDKDLNNLLEIERELTLREE